MVLRHFGLLCHDGCNVALKIFSEHVVYNLPAAYSALCQRLSWDMSYVEIQRDLMRYDTISCDMLRCDEIW